MATQNFSGQISVAARIIDYLSSGLYRSPAACLKELVNNSYDADATRTDIYVKPDADRIIVEDNGTGMNRKEFENHFQRISESHKRGSGETTDKGRKKIGLIGIGFIAANELCREMEVFSTKSGSTELLYVTINFDEMSRPPEERRKSTGEFVKADYEGETLLKTSIIRICS
jgi:HSP90 family molecular chaperone